MEWNRQERGLRVKVVGDVFAKDLVKGRIRLKCTTLLRLELGKAVPSSPNYPSPILTMSRALQISMSRYCTPLP